MRKIIIVLLSIIPGMVLAQVQIGQDVDGEAAFDGLGLSVSLNNAGTRFATGTPFNNGNGSSSGHIRVYELNGSNQWTQLGQDIDGEAAGDQMGRSVSLNGMGDRLATGAQSNDGNGNGSGHTQIYELNNGNQWVQIGQDIDGEAAGDSSGISISLNNVGDRVVIGAYGNDGNGTSSGHARIYHLNASGQWVQLGQDLDGDAAYDNFGGVVDINEIGDRVIVSSWLNDANGNNAGLVRVFELNSGNQWVQLGQDLLGENENDSFGRSIAIDALGNRIVVGAIGSDAGGVDRGQVYIYELNGSNQWVQLGQGIIGEAVGDQSGFSTSINAIGDRVATSSFNNNGNGTQRGHIRVYKLNGSNQWQQLGEDINGEADQDQSGFAINFNATGDYVAIGATANDGNGTSSGHVRVFDVNPVTLGLDENELRLEKIKCYPNPTSSILNLETSLSIEEVRVFSILGKEILKSKSKTIDVSTLYNGMYFVEIETKNNRTQAFRFIKN